MTRHRSRLQIIRDLLGVVGEGSRKTHIMYGANLSYGLLCRYLDLVVEAGLVRVVRGSGTPYKITRKGERFLERYEEFSERRERLRQQVDGFETKEAELEAMCSVPGGR